jgi:anti-sigma regulatory factor (Ser/Thr protein kinase)
VTERLVLTVDDAAGALARAQRELERWLDALGLAPRPAYRAQLVFEEIATNVLKYGWPAGAGPRALSCQVELRGDRLRLHFRDRGAPFDPTSAAPAPRPASIGEARVGGLGLGLVRRSAAALSYRREAGENLTEVVIALEPASAAAEAAERR